MKPNLEQDFWTANLFIWPMVLKIIPAMFLVSNILHKKAQKNLCLFFYVMGLWNMIAFQGYPDTGFIWFWNSKYNLPYGLKKIGKRWPKLEHVAIATIVQVLVRSDLSSGFQIIINYAFTFFF